MDRRSQGQQRREDALPLILILYRAHPYAGEEKRCAGKSLTFL